MPADTHAQPDIYTSIPEELRNSLDRILNYAELPDMETAVLQSSLDEFRRLDDKSFSDPAARKLREDISSIYFDLYRRVLKKVIEEANQDRLYRMFLNLGYLDERLLTPEQVNQLYVMAVGSPDNSRYAVYDLAAWLQKIYQREKDPSINEFEQDYYDVFREQKKQGHLTDRDKLQYENDIEARLSHEIDNLFKLGQRLCYGKVGGYFPILHSGMISRDLIQSVTTPVMIEKSLDRILAVDFSAFHREIVYNQPEQRIVRELVMKAVTPDIILMPTFGYRGAMWQELTGRVTNSPGRFIFPVFAERSLDDLTVEVVAQFRWDLAKTMAGYVRNDIHESSLYTDYTDYIQFFSKNSDLTPEARTKIRKQIEKNRGNVRNIFISDYHTWINYESQGMLRLNKVARSILFKHCTFSRSIRENLVRQPLFRPMITQFDDMQAQRVKSIRARYHRIKKNNSALDPELEKNLLYYEM